MISTVGVDSFGMAREILGDGTETESLGFGTDSIKPVWDVLEESEVNRVKEEGSGLVITDSLCLVALQ